jgi:hypothetical protein
VFSILFAEFGDDIPDDVVGEVVFATELRKAGKIKQNKKKIVASC